MGFQRSQLLAEKDASGNTTAQYTHGYTPIQGIGSLVEAKKEVDSCTYYQYPIYDHRGTVVKLVDENGETVGEYHYNAWGLAFQEEEIGATNRFGWQSNWLKLTDSQEGLLLSPTRIYLAKEGRFLQRDWIKSINIYQSFANKPLIYNDILGLSVIDIEEQIAMPLETGGGGGGSKSGGGDCLGTGILLLLKAAEAIYETIVCYIKKKNSKCEEKYSYIPLPLRREITFFDLYAEKLNNFAV